MTLIGGKVKQMEVNISLKNGYKVESLNINNVEKVLSLCEKCSDFYMLHDGILPTIEEAEDIFTSLPPNNTYDDKYVLGIYNLDKELVGLIETVKNYPVIDSWIIGMMCIEPNERSNGLGKTAHDAVKEWVKSLGAKSLRLGAIEENVKGIKFWSSLGYKKIKEVSKDYEKKTHIVYVMVMDL